MNKRTTAQWRELFAAYQASGLSQARFCKEHNLCPKYFSLRRRQLNASEATKPGTRLIQVQPPKLAADTGVSLHYQGMELRFGQEPDATLIAGVMRQLA